MTIERINGFLTTPFDSAGALLEFYRRELPRRVGGYRLDEVGPIMSTGSDEEVAGYLERRFCFNGKCVEMGDTIDWYAAPDGDLEWNGGFVRQGHFMYLADRYRATGDERYAAAVVEQMLDYIRRVPPYDPEGKPYLEYKRSTWRPFEAPCRMAFSNGVLPNPNDGWPNLNLKTYSYLYEMGAKVFDSGELRDILAVIYAQGVPRTALPMSSPVYAGDHCMEWLLFSRSDGKRAGPLPCWGSSCNFAASCYAMLRQKHCEVFFKYGHRSPSHAHPDKMNLEVTAFGVAVSRDLSNCGYAARLCNEYHRTSVSHNTVVLDGRNHPDTQPGECLAYDKAGAALAARVRDAYPGVEFRRCVRLDRAGFRDEFTVLGDEAHTMDWFFHVEGEPETLPESMPASLGYEDDGYRHLHEVRRLVCDGPALRLKWNFGGVRGVQELDAADKQVYLCRSYDNPVNRMRWTVILRARGSGAVFAQRWQFSGPQREEAARP